MLDMIKDLLIGVAVTWITVTPEGKRFRDKMAKMLAEKYMLPKKEVKPKKETETE